MMDYRKRDYQCPSRKSQNDYKYEMAYELGADYQEALVERKSEYLQNVKQKEICKHATEFGQEMEIMNNQNNNQYNQNDNDRQHQSDRQHNQENRQNSNQYRSEFSQENQFQQNNSDRQHQSDRQNNQSNRQNNK